MTREESIFSEALAVETPAERAAFVQRACAGDAALRDLVDSLLQANDEVGGILESPPDPIDPTIDLPPATPERLGSSVGPYRLLQQIGEGGMGVVYMAEQSRPVRRMVALKIIKPGMDSSQVIARFEAERQALAMMEHPNIARVFDAGTTESGRPYFAMELVRGIPITEYCDRHQLTPQQRLELFVPVCEAVQHAHQKGVIHRDLKPTNVLVTLQDGDKPTAKVIDFGIAKATAGQRLTDLTLFTEFRQLIGTPLYMSPEQAEMSVVMDVDTRSDVYSLGVLLYELLTGTTPFDKRRLAEVAFDEVRRIIREEEPPRPSTRLSSLAADAMTTISASRASDPRKLSATIRGELDWIVMKALEKERSRRYETANGLARDIGRYLADQPVEACPPSRAYRLRKFYRRNKALIGVGAVIATVLIAATIISARQAIRATRAERQVARERDQAQAEQRRADEQTAIAGAVSQFLNEDVLAQAGPSFQATPDFAPDPDLKVRDALDRAAARISERFPDQPLIQAAIHEAIGRAYTDLEQFKDKAEPHLREALRLRSELLPADDPAVLKTHYFLGVMYGAAGRFSSAAREWEPVLAARRKTLGNQHPDTLKTMAALTQAYAKLSRYEEGEALALEVLRTNRAAGRDDDSNTDSATWGLAMIYANQGRHAERLPLQESILEHIEKRYGAQSPFALSAKVNLGSNYSAVGDYDRAVEVLLQAVDGLRNAYGEKNRGTQRAMRNLAWAYLGQKKAADAEQLFKRVIELQRETLGERYPDGTAQYTLGELTEVYLEQGRLDEAEAILERILRAHRKLPTTSPISVATTEPIRSPGTARSMAGLGYIYWKKKQLQQAEQFLVAALAGQRSVNGLDDGETLGTAASLGEFYFEQKDYVKAEPLLLEAVEGYRKRRNDEALRNYAQILVKLYEARNEPERAAAWRARIPATSPATRSSAAGSPASRPSQH